MNFHRGGLGLFGTVVETIGIFMAVGSSLEGAGGDHGAKGEDSTGEEGEGRKGHLHGLMMPQMPKTDYPLAYVKD